METIFDLFLWGIAGALILAPLGALFGLVVRVVAQAHDRVSEATPRQAAFNGFVSGGLFLAVMGFLLGAVTGYGFPQLSEGLGVMVLIFIGTLALMLTAGLFAGFAYFCTWLGVRGTSLLLTLAIGLGFAGIIGPKAGLSRVLLAWLQGGLGSTGLGLLVFFRLRSPAKQHAFEPWDVNEHE